jgi:hypothetical protein
MSAFGKVRFLTVCQLLLLAQTCKAAKRVWHQRLTSECFAFLLPEGRYVGQQTLSEP